MSPNSVKHNYNELQKVVISILSNIIDSNIKSFRKEKSFKVRPNYGYDKFYLDHVDGSYDMSLQSLIHYIMYEEGVYKKILNKIQYEQLEKIIKKNPSSIYSPDFEDSDYGEIQNTLDTIYSRSIQFVGRRLLELGFDVKRSFADYLEYDES
jgi:hypothetical protein